MLRIRSLPLRSMVPVRHSPPYLPTASCGFTTSGAGGRRWSTGGSLPPLTRSASMGASLYFATGAAVPAGALVAAGGWVAAGAALVGSWGGTGVGEQAARAAAAPTAVRRKNCRRDRVVLLMDPPEWKA